LRPELLLAKYRRYELGLSASAVAIRAGMTQPEVTLIENGRLKPSPAQLEKLARALGVTRPAALLEEVRLIDSQQAVLNEVVTA
jgi:transcriptional regulator with XRE-family HTH domain